MRILRFLFVAAALAAAVSCGRSPTSPTPAPAFTITDLTVGDGTAASNGKTLTVNYTGWLYDVNRPENKGSQFDTSVGGQPFKFVLGTGQVILGWDRGLSGMKVGGKRRLIIPPELGYGQFGSGSIPGNASLVFDIDLVAVQ